MRILFTIAIVAALLLPQSTRAATDSIVDIALEIAARDTPDLDAARVRNDIATLASTYKKHVGRDASADERARAFAWLLFEHAGFTSTTDLSSLNTLQIDRVLATRRGYCLSLTIVALAVAEAVDEPLTAVALPHHVLVRWDDGRTRHALELTESGRTLSDDELRARIGPFARDDTIYGRALSRDEVRGMLLHNRAFVLAGRGDQRAALTDLAAARKLAPTLPEIARTRGVALGELRRWDEAIESFERALVLHPGDVDTLVNMALARQAAGQLEGAREDATMARLLDPSHPRLAELDVAFDATAVKAQRAVGDPPSDRRDGLFVEFFADTSLSARAATTVTRDIDFDWKRGQPARGVSRDHFSTRLSGWIEIEKPGKHTIFVVANDGVRVTIGDRRVVDHWRDTGDTSWTLHEDVVLAAGWHPLVVEHYDRRGNARLVAMLTRDGERYPLDLGKRLHHTRP